MSRALINVPAKAKRGEVIAIKTLIAHKMETGFRYTNLGERIPRDIITGFVATYLDPSTGPAVLGESRTIRRLDPAALDTLVPYPLARYYVVATSAPADSATSPVRLAPPPLDEGNHASYAFQWFAFATIALGGAGVLAWQRRNE